MSPRAVRNRVWGPSGSAAGVVLRASVDKEDQSTTYARAHAKGAVIEEGTGEPTAAAAKLMLYFTGPD